MIVITLNEIKNLNVSLQVGDLIYSKYAEKWDGASDRQGAIGLTSSGVNTASKVDSLNRVGTLIKITKTGSTVELLVDTLNNIVGGGAVSSCIDGVDEDCEEFEIPSFQEMKKQFLMFSKYNQTMGDVIGYYAKARLVNHSTKKAEIFSVGSEVIINSK
mgnify:CR=1 FL=1